MPHNGTMTTPPDLNVWTSRYSNPALAQAAEDGYVLARITMGNARFFRLPCVRIKEFEPSKAEFALPETPEGDAEFTRSFKLRLTEAGPAAALAPLIAHQGDAPGIILLCFEDVRKGDLCHRTMVAEWLAENLALEVNEWPDPSVPKKTKPKADTLL
jgi:hypothetical protein